VTSNVPLDVNVWMVYSPTVVTLPPVARGSLDEQDAGDEGDGVIVQFAAVSVPRLHELFPDTVYPELHVGWHVDPLARELVQLPTAPFVGAVDASHGIPCRRYTRT